MTEDSTMDKKNYGILTSKCLAGPAQDTSRPRQDGSGGNQTIKNYPRTTTRRRESPNNQSNAVKTRPETAPVRKPTPQKSKAMDKRPRARGGSNLQSVVEDESKKGPELGSLQTPGSKKQSLNHLLNFHFAPRDNRTLSAASWRSYNTYPGGGWRARQISGGTTRPKFNKENFLQANCQFLVKSTGDYSVHKYNPDVLVDWDLIEQIYIRVAGEFPNCPICLSPPVAAKMTKCGHIFCWPCLLHYLALSDKKCRKCPICFESVYKHELKSVVATHYEDVQVGEELEMQLMFRKKGLFQAMPLMCKDGPTFNWESIFTKLLPVSPAEVKAIVLEREARELRIRYEEEKHTPEICFVEQAMSELETRLSNVDSVEHEVSPSLNTVLEALNMSSGVDFMSTDSSPSSEETRSFQADDNKSLLKQRNDSIGNDSVATNGSEDDASVGRNDDYFYFYQAVKGENIFLHPINMAMLWKSFGNDPTTWPQVVQFRVIEKEYVIMMEDVRKRLKFLQHLPLTTNVQLIEVDLTPPIVTEEVLAEFSHQLDSRKKRRVQRAREERRRERKLEEEERKRDHHQCPRFEFQYDFPEYNSFDFETGLSASLNDADAFAPHEETVLALSATDDENPLVDRNSNLDLNYGAYSNSPPGMSFAQIVSQKATSQAAAKQKQAGVWGKSWKGVDTFQNASTSKDTESEADSGEYTSVPAYRMSMSDAIARAIANVEEVDDAGNCQVNNSGKKKGRKKGKVLFATGMGCYK